MSSVPRSVLDYWREVFGCDILVTNDRIVSLTINPRLSPQRRAMILETAGSTRAALTPAVAKKAGLDRNQILPAEALRTRLADSGVTLHEPDYLFYLAATPMEKQTINHKTMPRRLTEADREAFDAFRAEASDQDLDDAYVELGHWAVFGCFDGSRLITAASMYPWDNSLLADLGVLTLPDARGKGHARAVVQAICRFAREKGYEPQYRCQLDNAASIALANASGLMLFGTWEVIRSDGQGWRVERQDDGLWLFYISPSLQGDERAILIREAEADALAAGERTLDDVLIANRAS